MARMVLFCVRVRSLDALVAEVTRIHIGGPTCTCQWRGLSSGLMLRRTLRLRLTQMPCRSMTHGRATTPSAGNFA